MASSALGRRLGLGDLIACDMGGTSFEACLLPGSRARVHEPRGARVRRPDRAHDGRRPGDRRRRRLLAWVDAAGHPQGRARAARAPIPGPACYGRGGTQATVTDANVVLGRLAPEFLLAGRPRARRRGGRRRRSTTLAERARALARARRPGHRRRRQLATWRRRCGSSRPTAATTRAARRSSPTAAPARCTPASSRGRCRCQQVLVPRYPGAFSAFGALLADTRFDYTQTSWMRMSPARPRARRTRCSRARAAGRRRLPRGGLRRGAAPRALDRHALRRPELGAQRDDAGRRR